MIGQGVEFADVTVIEAAKPNTPAADLLMRLMDWMQMQRAIGRRSKKVLQHDASIELQAHLTTRSEDGVS
jgi:hypothetical protein